MAHGRQSGTVWSQMASRCECPVDWVFCGQGGDATAVCHTTHNLSFLSSFLSLPESKSDGQLLPTKARVWQGLELSLALGQQCCVRKPGQGKGPEGF